MGEDGKDALGELSVQISYFYLEYFDFWKGRCFGVFLEDVSQGESRDG